MTLNGLYFLRTQQWPTYAVSHDTIASTLNLAMIEILLSLQSEEFHCFFKYFAFLKMPKLADSVIQLTSIVAKWRPADETFIVGVYVSRNRSLCKIRSSLIERLQPCTAAIANQ